MAKKKTQIPEEFKDLWNLDYYKLTGEQRKAITEFYMNHLQRVQSGSEKKIDFPYFMTQEDVLKKEEDIKMNVDVMVEKEKKDLEEQQRIENDKVLWESRKILKIDEVEKLMLENIQLKLELVEKSMKELNNKKKELEESQIRCAQGLESKYKVVLDDYAIDLVSGVMMRYASAGYREPPKK